jgi:sarcosine/dimethylglycine N-methyltransferase
MAVEESNPAATAAYYDDAAISKFYEVCWGGSDIHIGLYASGDETVLEASAAMTRHQLERTGVRSDQRVLDIACGFGGTLRALASMGCRATGLDISKVNVDYVRKANADTGLNSMIDVAVGDFHAIDSEADAWDVVICQDALIHSPDRPKVFAEVYRVLRSGGAFGFSDILTGEDADLTIVNAAFARLGVPAGTTSSDYQEMARAAGFEIEFAEERASDIKAHYDKLAKALAKPIADLDDRAVAAISASISRWQAALAGDHITWACFVARKPA